MGSATRNFYNDAFTRQGFGDDVREVQRLWRAGDREAAAKRVPIEIGLRTNLIGTDDLVRERLRLYHEAGITTLRAIFTSRDQASALTSRLPDLESDSGFSRSATVEICPAPGS